MDLLSFNHSSFWIIIDTKLYVKSQDYSWCQWFALILYLRAKYQKLMPITDLQLFIAVIKANCKIVCERY